MATKKRVRFVEKLQTDLKKVAEQEVPSKKKDAQSPGKLVSDSNPLLFKREVSEFERAHQDSDTNQDAFAIHHTVGEPGGGAAFEHVRKGLWDTAFATTSGGSFDLGSGGVKAAKFSLHDDLLKIYCRLVFGSGFDLGNDSSSLTATKGNLPKIPLQEEVLNVLCHTSSGGSRYFSGLATYNIVTNKFTIRSLNATGGAFGGDFGLLNVGGTNPNTWQATDSLVISGVVHTS